MLSHSKIVNTVCIKTDPHEVMSVMCTRNHKPSVVEYE